MKKNVWLVMLAVGTCFSLVGCVRAPFVPPQGYVVSNIKAPLDVDFNDTDMSGLKQGSAKVTNVLGLFSFGDAGAKAAATEGGISTIVHADYKHLNVLGIFQQTTVIVYGK